MFMVLIPIGLWVLKIAPPGIAGLLPAGLSGSEIPCDIKAYRY
jgi:hypothetical protein